MPEAAHRPFSTHRPDLSNRSLVMLSVATAILLGLFTVAGQWLAADTLRPGSRLLQSSAIAGSIALLMPFVFSLGKRTGVGAVPNRLFIMHVVASLLGLLLVGAHALAGAISPPTLLLLCLFLLALSGAYARLRIASAMAATLGTKTAPFAAVDPARREALRRLIEQKESLLCRLDPLASEATFSVTLAHRLRSPLLSLAYDRLVREESRLIGTRRSVPPMQAWWRPVHLALAWLFLLGLLVHVVLVTFFAGYVADGGTIYWWHLADWGL